MMLAIGSDHAGYPLKQALLSYLEENSVSYRDFGCKGEPCHYPDIAKTVCEAVQNGEAQMAILVCGTGVGMSMAANKMRGIRACCCTDTFSAKYTRLHNDANVLCLGARVLGAGLAEELVDVFLHTEFEGGRHQLRVDLIHNLEEEQIAQLGKE